MVIVTLKQKLPSSQRQMFITFETKSRIYKAEPWNVESGAVLFYSWPCAPEIPQNMVLNAIVSLTNNSSGLGIFTPNSVYYRKHLLRP